MFLTVTFIVGLIIGSFISVVSFRLPMNEDFVFGRSYCPSCKNNLSWFDNVPLLSYILYRGKSRCCQKKISIRYPLIELAAAMGLVVFAWHFGQTLNLIVYSLIYLTCLAIFVIDLENQIIPDELSFFLVFLSFFLVQANIFENLFAGFLVSTLILLINLITKGKGMGLGDVKLVIGLGMILGLVKSFNFLFVSFLTGGIIASILLLVGSAKLKTKVAFGPFLIFGFLVTLLF